MTKKWGILFVSILAIGVAGFCLKSARPEKTIPVTGPLSAQDIADIKRLVKQDLGRKVLPNFSWRSFAALPASARNYFEYEILEINAATNSSETIAVVRLPGHKTPVEFVALYRLSKNTDRWKMKLVIPMVSRRMEKQIESMLLQLPGRPILLTNTLPRPIFAPPWPVRQAQPPFAIAPPPFQPAPVLPPASSEDFKSRLQEMQKQHMALMTQQRARALAALGEREQILRARLNGAFANSPPAPLPTPAPIAFVTNAVNVGAL